MKILQVYILKLLLRNLVLSAIAFTLLFLLFDFFDRIDALVAEGAPTSTIFLYFVLKIPLTLNLMLPISMLVATLLTFGLLSRNSEVTAIRAAGIQISWIARPLVLTGICVSLGAIVMNETLVPYTSRRVKEIYNIDIKQKDKTGTYSQSDFWWRDGARFYAADMFDSRNNSLINLSYFDTDSELNVLGRTDSERAKPVDPVTGWDMEHVTKYHFTNNKGSLEMDSFAYPTLPLTISQRPQDFYDVRADRNSMSYFQLKAFIKKQQASGIVVNDYFADLYEKLSFPFVNLLTTLVALPFALKPARSGSMAASVFAGLIIGFTYYAVHYFSLALGRAELWPPMLAAWMANILMGFVAIILNVGAESPS